MRAARPDVYAKVWKIQVGRIPLYLMDTDVAQNQPGDRELSARLYGGDQNLRISQEFVLGIGGVRAVRALGLAGCLAHERRPLGLPGPGAGAQLCAGAGVELRRGARAGAGQHRVYHPHPGPGGARRLQLGPDGSLLSHYWPQLGLEREQFLELACHDQTWGPGFSMTVLALRMAGRSNGVAALHGEVSRDVDGRWPLTPVDEVPIGHVTNGVHLETWLGPDMAALLDAHLPADWRERLDDPNVLDGIYTIPDEAFWQVHRTAKRRLIQFVRRRARNRAIRQGELPAVLELIDSVFDEDAFTIGFARRFATYKRATLIFRDMERFDRLLNNPLGPAQVMFSGKTRPTKRARPNPAHRARGADA